MIDRMDAVAGLLDGPRARGAFLLRPTLSAPWSMLVRDEAPLTLMAFVRGSGWIVPENGEAVRMRPGDVALARGDDSYVVADDPGTAPQVHILPGNRCQTPEGQDVDVMEFLGTRTWGNDPEGEDVFVVGAYDLAGEIPGRLLRVLPQLLVLRDEEWDTPLIGLLADEVIKDDPGQDAVLDRLLDLLVISALRAWFSREDAETPAWYRAQGDPIVGRALRLIYDNPAHPWTVEKLAHAVGLSRAALARRFNELVGEPPMAFLTGWRIALAADLIEEPGATIGSVAEQVGYGSSFALSTAFKRVRGISPQQHKKRAAAA
jgi:AraC-like DNA-binding protein